MSIISSFLDQATFKNLFYFKLSSGYFHKYPTFVHKAKIKQKLKTHHMWQLCAVMTSWVQWWVQCYQINTWKNGNNGNFEKDFTFFSASKTKCSESFSKKPTQPPMNSTHHCGTLLSQLLIEKKISIMDFPGCRGLYRTYRSSPWGQSHSVKKLRHSIPICSKCLSNYRPGFSTNTQILILCQKLFEN